MVLPEQASRTKTFQRFTAIEGLRGWLAWTVVGSHLLYSTDLYRSGKGQTLAEMGHLAVLVFVIISGFVITHLQLEKRETYLPYISRRFLRIYPLFLITCALGGYSLYLYRFALSHVSWAHDPLYIFDDTVTHLLETQNAYFGWQVVAHATMFHGALGNNILPQSQYVFLAPAWSISLEWQFYLCAPVVLMLIRSRLGMFLLIAVTCVGHYAYLRGWLGEFRNPSILPAAAAYFGIGIVTRILLPALPQHLKWRRGVICLAPLFILANADFLPILFWCGFCMFMMDERPPRFFKWFFESKIVQYVGRRSYSIYLSHLIIIAICEFAMVKIFPAVSRKEALVILAAVVVPLTLSVSIFLYRYVESPGIRLGNKFARLFSKISQNAVKTD